MKEWWQNLAIREKQTLIIGAIIVSIFILYAFIWSPLMDAVGNERAKLTREQKLLVFMREANRTIKHAQTRDNVEVKAVSPIILISVLQKRINQMALQPSVSQLKQGMNNTVQVNFHDGDYDKIIQLLNDLVSEYNVSIQQMTVIKAKSNGLVNADIILNLA
jgi:type II secretory pathway component PulM